MPEPAFMELGIYIMASEPTPAMFAPINNTNTETLQIVETVTLMLFGLLYQFFLKLDGMPCHHMPYHWHQLLPL
jgi:hypothetical protein